MLLNEVIPDEVVKSRHFDMSAYHVTLSGAAAKILHDGIYSGNKRHLAAMREIANNAVDSHIQAGKADVPIRVHLPTEDEPFFRVSDEGVGLDADEVRDLFGGYFSSRTRESRKGTGCFGLGAKAPFAYASQFVITAVKAGTLCVFSAYMNADGVPEMALIRHESTDRGNGVSVEFAVEPGDINQFVTDGLSLFNAYEVAPVLDDDDHTEALKALRAYLDELTVERGDGWRLVSGFHPFRGAVNGGGAMANFGAIRLIGGHAQSIHSNLVIMGHVAYPLDTATLVSEAHREWLGDDCEAIRRLSNLIVDLDIATEPVEVHPSREQLSYTPMTVRRLVERLRAFLDEYRSRHSVCLEGMNDWDRIAYANDILQERPRWVRFALGLGKDETINLDAIGMRRRLAEHGARVQQLALAADSKHMEDRQRFCADDCEFVVRPSRHTLVIIQNGGQRVHELAAIAACDHQKALAQKQPDGSLRLRRTDVILVRPGPRVSDREAFRTEADWFIDQMGGPAPLYTADLWKAHKSRLNTREPTRDLARLTVVRPDSNGYYERLRWNELSEQEREGLLDGSITAVTFCVSRNQSSPCEADTRVDITRRMARNSIPRTHAPMARAIAERDPEARLVMLRPSDQKLADRLGNAVPFGDYLHGWLSDLDSRTLRVIRRTALRSARDTFRNANRLSGRWIDYAHNRDLSLWNQVLDTYAERYGTAEMPTSLVRLLDAESRMKRFYRPSHHRSKTGGDPLCATLIAIARNLADATWPVDGECAVPGLADIANLVSRFRERLAARYGNCDEYMQAVFAGLSRDAFIDLLRYETPDKLVRQLRMERLMEETE